MNAKVLVTLCFALASLTAQAYEQATHAALTARAFLSSDLFGSSGGFSTLIRELGLDTFEPFGKDEAYFEVLTTSVNTVRLPRVPQSYERAMLLDVFGRSGISAYPERWLIYGAIREDDNPSEDPPTPQDVAPGVLRPLNHFFDPVLNRPLSAPLAVGEKAVDWAIGTADSFADPNRPERPRLNSFTIFDARDAMFKALTLLSNDGGTFVDIASDQTPSVKQEWRQTYWATAFRALGDVLHLNQDMAQPQHTRNEPHSGSYCPATRICVTGHTSVYEKYIRARSINKDTFNTLSPFRQSVQIGVVALPLGPYPIPTFGNFSDYWSTAPGNKQTQGKGLADYSNHGFFSAAKNFGSSEYISPSSNSSDYEIRRAVPAHWDGSAPSDLTPVQIYYGKVRDELQENWATDVPLTTFGVWDQFLLAKSNPPQYSLNRLNYDAMADLLLPRAVAYSAGLINFFFRGRIDIALPDEGVFALADHGSIKGFPTLRAKVKNVTPSFADAQGNPQLQNMRGGTFFAVVRYHADKQYVDSLDKIVGASPCAAYTDVINMAKLDASTACRDGVEQIVVSKPLVGVSLDANAQTTVEFDFTASPIPFAMTDVVLQIVYRGPLGSETDAVAVGTLDVSEPTYFTYQNASDYIHIDGHVYTRGDVDSSLELLSKVQPQSCVNYRLSPPHLVDGCLEQFQLDLTVSFSDLAKPIAQVSQLPNHRFIRIAYLTEADEGFNPPIKAAPRRVKVNVQRHDSNQKALLYHEGTCLPLDPFDIPPRHSQLNFSPTQVSYRLDTLNKLRGVNGWLNASCVIDGDNATPGSPDDRVSVMAPLLPLSPEVEPFPVTLMADYL
jgi:hypothetical protein